MRKQLSGTNKKNLGGDTPLGVPHGGYSGGVGGYPVGGNLCANNYQAQTKPKNWGWYPMGGYPMGG